MDPFPAVRSATERTPGAVLSAKTDGGTAIGLSGDIDGEGAQRLRGTIEDALAPGAVLTVDLTRVTHLSQAALAVLVQAHRRLRDSGGSLRLEGTSEAVVRTLRISGLHRVFTVETAGPSPVAHHATGA